jgi:predicted nucleic acid-binding protein
LSVLVLGEIRPRKLARWIDNVRVTFEGRILPIDPAVADEWGRLSAAAAVPVVDGLLVATAKVHGLVLATRNVRDVARTGANVVNPFEPGSA